MFELARRNVVGGGLRNVPTCANEILSFGIRNVSISRFRTPLAFLLSHALFLDPEGRIGCTLSFFFRERFLDKELPALRYRVLSKKSFLSVVTPRSLYFPSSRKPVQLQDSLPSLLFLRVDLSQ